MRLNFKFIKALFVLLILIGLINKGDSNDFAGYTIRNEQGLQRHYQSQWIWAALKDTVPFQYVRFRKRIELDQPIEDATAFVTGDTFYRLWVNGKFVMYGPARSSQGTITIDPVPVTAWLKPGINTVEAEVLFYNGRFEALGQAPGFFCELELKTGDTWRVIGTDSTWESREVRSWSRRSPKFSYQRTYLEDIDARMDQDEQWCPAVVLGEAGMAPWKNVLLRDIPLPDPRRTVLPDKVVSVHKGDGFVGELKGTPELESTRYGPRPDWCKRLQTEQVQISGSAAMNPKGLLADGSEDAVLSGDGASIVYDFGANYVGFIGFEITGSEGQTLEIAWNESLDEGGWGVRPIQGIEATQALRYVLRDGHQTYIAFNPHLARYVRVVQRGDGQIKLHHFWMVDHSFAIPEQGTFECSDEGLNRIYRAALRTAKLNTLDTFMDNPGRERGSWMREGYWTAQCVYYAFGDLSVSRRMVRYGADSQSAQGHVGPPGMVQMLYPATNVDGSFIPAHALYWCLQAGLHERYSSDTAFVRGIMPAVRRLMDSFKTWRNAEGLLENIDGWNFLDWAEIRTGDISVALNAIYARTLDEVAMLERSIGEASRAEQSEYEAAMVRESLNRYCQADLFYPDALMQDSVKHFAPSREICEATQYFILWAEVPSPERAQHMWKALCNNFRPTPGDAQPVMGLSRGGLYSFFERLQTAARQGDHAILIRDVKDMFQPMADSSPGTLWEHPQRQWCLCQGISSGVAAILTEEILGINMDHGLRILPNGGGQLQWCNGQVTTHLGRIGVKWIWSKDRYVLEVDIPQDVTAEVILPPEAKTVWQSAASTGVWPEKLHVSGPKLIQVHPGHIQELVFPRPFTP